MRSIFFYISICLTLSGIGQQVFSWQLNYSNGLPSNTIYDIHQDRNGYIWLGTNAGLVRYDGKNFRKYSAGSKGESALGGLGEDCFGTIWGKTFDGDIVYLKNDTICTLHSWKPLNKNGFPNILVKDNRILIATNCCMYQYNIEDESYDTLIHTTAEYRLGAFEVQENGTIWLFAEKPGEFKLISIKNGKPAVCFPIEGNFAGASTYFFSMQNQVYLVDFRNLYYALCTENGLSAQKIPITGIEKEIKWTHPIAFDGETPAFAGYDGLYVYPKTGMRHLLPGVQASTVMQDSEGNYWVGTLTAGIYIIPSMENQLYSVKESLGNMYSTFYSEPASSVLYAGTYNGLILEINDTGVSRIISTGSASEIQSIFKHQDQLWSYGDLLTQIDCKTGKIIHQYTVTSVKKMAFFENRLYLATSGGMQTREINSTLTSNDLANVRCKTVAIDTFTHTVWIGSQNGLFYKNLRTGELREWKLPGSAYSLTANDIWAGESDRIWIASNNNGLIGLKNGKPVYHFTPENSLIPARILSIAEGPDEIWCNSDDKVYCVHISTGKVDIWDKTKGLIESEIIKILWKPDAIWVLTLNGIQKITHRLGKNPVIPRLLITGISYDGKKVEDNHFILPFGVSDFIVQFAALPNIRSRGTLQVRYRLVNLDTNWNVLDKNADYIKFTSLPPDRYQLEMQVINEDGIVSEITTLTFQISAPYYQKWWFYVLVTAAVATVCFVAYLLRVKAVRRKAETIRRHQNLEQQMQIATLSSIRAQINPHFIFNTLSTIQSKIVTDDKQAANSQIILFAKLMRKVLEVSSRETIPLSEEIQIIEMYLHIEQIRLNYSLEFTIDIDPAIDIEEQHIPSLLTQPFIENAIKHGLMHKEGQKKLWVSVTEENEHIRIEIEDNGIGRVKSAEYQRMPHETHESFAVQAFQKRIDVLNQLHQTHIQLHIEDRYNPVSKQPAGTTVRIIVPKILHT